MSWSGFYFIISRCDYDIESLPCFTMPGKLLSFAVKVGDTVKAGQALAVMEAMKMEHTVAAPADGTVAELLYAPGDQVNEGAPLLRLESQEA
jgi:3-methylcrotonyl-CoA carboxylase alpha subunit